MSIIDEKIKYFNDDNFKPRIFPKPILHKIKLFVLIVLFPQILYKYALYIYTNYHNNYEQLLIINQSNLLLITALLICFYAIFISPLSIRGCKTFICPSLNNLALLSVGDPPIKKKFPFGAFCIIASACSSPTFTLSKDI